MVIDVVFLYFLAGSQAMLHDDTEPPLMTLVLAMGPKLLVKSAVEKILPTKPRNEYTSREVSQLCAEAVDVIKRSGVEYDEVTFIAASICWEDFYAVA